uniref:Uncharacterized protein n=1 Tax=Digenea simplex TaxID=945030 RepID=A0A1Z1MTS6_DIGSM|nr:hypothetical protein [Digenea simplex]ARW69493.1 hypothetical protein [Digenea simplex]
MYLLLIYNSSLAVMIINYLHSTEQDVSHVLLNQQNINKETSFYLMAQNHS